MKITNQDKSVNENKDYGTIQFGNHQNKDKRLISLEKLKLDDFESVTSFDNIIFSAQDFINIDVPKSEIILEPWFRKPSIIMLVGPKGIGKTWVALSQSSAISEGKNFGPWKAGNPARCLYIDGEMAAQSLIDRIRRLNLNENIFILSDAIAHVANYGKINLKNKQDRYLLTEALIQKKIEVVFFDNISSLTWGLDENAKKDWDEINQWLISLRFQAISSVLIHHTGKREQQRGTSAREDNIDVEIVLRKPLSRQANQAKFIWHFEKVRASGDNLVDYEFNLIDNNDQFYWEWHTAKGETKREILKLIDEGRKQSEIVELVDVGKSRVSQIIAYAKEKDGYLGKDGKLTKLGEKFVYGESNDS